MAFISGTNGDDLLIGTDGDDIIVGLAGDDTINGGTGVDILDPGTGSDVVNGGAGDDIVRLSTFRADFGFLPFSQSQLNGGAGLDTLDFRAAPRFLNISPAISLANASTLSVIDRYNLTGFEVFLGGPTRDQIELTNYTVSVTVDASAGDDSIFGGSGADTLIGGDGADYIVGGAFDKLFGELGNDFFSLSDIPLSPAGVIQVDGGAGIDTLRFVNNAVSVDLQGLSRFRNQDLLITGIENVEVIGDESAVRSVLGDGNANRFFVSFDNAFRLGVLFDGRDGDDTLTGGRFDDTLRGGAGNDFISPGNGSDLIDGGDGFDIVSFSDSAISIDLNLRLGRASGDGADSLVFIEGARGSRFSDVLVGDASDNLLDGGAGVDFIDGDGGGDFLLGGAGNDRVQGGAGVDLLGGEDGDDRLNGGNDSDNLFGGAGVDELFGEFGDDFVSGQEGDDVIGGSAGSDVLDGGAGADRFLIFNGDSVAGAADRIVGFQLGADRVDLSFIDARPDLAGDQAFTFRGVQTGPMSGAAAGTVHIGFISGVGIFLFGYTDGDGVADVIIDIGTFGITAGDLIL